MSLLLHLAQGPDFSTHRPPLLVNADRTELEVVVISLALRGCRLPLGARRRAVLREQLDVPQHVEPAVDVIVLTGHL